VLIRIEDNSAALTPFGSLAHVNLANGRSANSKSWTELLRTAFSERLEKRSDEIPAD
jgi:hypothetical protein